VTTVSLHDPQTLYRHWEEQQWSPFAIDLVADAEQWQTMGGEERDLVLWALSSLMVAEEQFITRYLSGRGCSPDSSSATPRSTTTSIATSATAPVPADGGGRGHHTWGRGPSDPARPAARGGRLARPSGPRRRHRWDAPGASANEIRAFALDGLKRRLKIIGVELA
jgi:hypothetical protein